jgi:hypothetical protein
VKAPAIVGGRLIVLLLLLLFEFVALLRRTNTNTLSHKNSCIGLGSQVCHTTLVWTDVWQFCGRELQNTYRTRWLLIDRSIKLQSHIATRIESNRIESHCVVVGGGGGCNTWTSLCSPLRQRTIKVVVGQCASLFDAHVSQLGELCQVALQCIAIQSPAKYQHCSGQ